MVENHELTTVVVRSNNSPVRGSRYFKMDGD
jgi:hypothetical protein